MENENENKNGDWSEIKTIKTKEPQGLKIASIEKFGKLITHKNEDWVQFEKPGLVISKFGYTFGSSNWNVYFSWRPNMAEPLAGQFQLGVVFTKAKD
jgi:hypothetical protein